MTADSASDSGVQPFGLSLRAPMPSHILNAMVQVTTRLARMSGEIVVLTVHAGLPYQQTQDLCAPCLAELVS